MCFVGHRHSLLAIVYNSVICAIILSHNHEAYTLLQSTEESFVDDVRHRLIPYLLRCDKLVPKSRHSLLSQYFLHLSENDLTLPLKVSCFIP